MLLATNINNPLAHKYNLRHVRIILYLQRYAVFDSSPIHKPILDNKNAQPWIVLLLAPMLFSVQSAYLELVEMWFAGKWQNARGRSLFPRYGTRRPRCYGDCWFTSQQVVFECQGRRMTYQAQIDASNGLMLASPRRATSPQHCVEV